MNLSENFSTMMQKFFIWTEENEYMLTDMINGSNIKWDMNLLSDFKEPGRNKIETFVKKLNKEYNLMKNSEKILDFKLMVKNFKENKPKIVKKDNKNVSLNKNKKIVNSLSVFVDKSLDTNNTYNIDTLEYFTDELINAFGKPNEIKDEDSRYEWKLNVDGEIFSIYDWIENKEKFEDKTWYLAGLNEDITKIKKIYDFIDNKNVDTTNTDIVSENTVMNTDVDIVSSNSESDNLVDVETINKDIKYSVDMNELFVEDDEDEKEINIDTINHDDVDINLDTVDETNLEIDLDNIEF
jgi:hypothetical protein